MRLGRLGATAAVLAAISVSAIPIAVAQETELPPRPPSPKALFGIKAEKFGQTTLEDGHFAYSVAAGSSVEDAIVLINYSEKDLLFSLYPADMQSAEGGAIAPAQRGTKMDGVGAWLKLEDPELATVGVAPKSRRSIPFVLDVPKGTPPGDYPGAVVAAVDVGHATKGLGVQTRAALMVRLTVPGKIDLDVEVGALSAERAKDGYRFDVPVRNKGNVLFTMVGTVELRRGGEVLARVPLVPKDIYVIPDGKADLRGVWKNPPKVGRVKAFARVNVAINREPSGTFSSSPKMLTLLPLLLGAVALSAILLFVITGIGTRDIRSRRRTRRRDEREIIRRHRADGTNGQTDSASVDALLPKVEAIPASASEYWSAYELPASSDER